MKIAIVVERPTQFDAPLFRHAAGDQRNRLRVLYTDPSAAAPAFDPEVGREVAWGTDLLAGYDAAVAPAAGRNAWVARELASRHDLVVVNGYTRRPYLVAARAARRAGSPTALRLDSVLFDEGSGARRLVKRLIFRGVVRRLFDVFLGVGTLTLDYLRSLGVPASRTGLYPYPVDLEWLRREAAQARNDSPRARTDLGLPAAGSIVLAVSKLHPRETPWDLLRAWDAAADHGRWLIIAGAGPDRPAVENFIRDQALAQVRLLGYVPYPALPALYAVSDLFVHAPREERWGVSVAEALACGVPVVASSRVGAAHDLLRSGANGFLYPAGDYAALASRIDEALRLPRETVARTSEGVLRGWGTAAAWQGLLEAAERAQELRA
jgi:glycosyltransferase involved in cell wall biosynthesis